MGAGGCAVLWLAASWLAGAAAAAAAGRPRCRSANCTDPGNDLETSVFKLYGGDTVFMELKEERSFVLVCGGALAADDPALPAAPRAARVARAALAGCRAPAGSYRAALAALNVTAARALRLALPPGEPPLRRRHLLGLTLDSLQIGSHDPDVDADLTDPSFLVGIKLRELDLNSVILNPEVLWTLPDSLERLSLNVAFDTTARPRSLSWIERLTSLRTLVLAYEDERGPPATPPSLNRLPRLTEVSLSVPLGLPQNWLNGSALTTLSLNNCKLKELPEDMFQGVNLSSLSLAGNNLTVLSDGVLSPLRRLRRLDVGGNALRGAALWRAAARLPALASLRARANPLGDACPDERELSALRALRSLQLAETSAARACAWPAAPALRRVDLSDNSVASLSYKELSARAAAERDVAIDLRYNPLRVIDVTPSDLDECRREKQPHVKVRLSLSALRCDCSNALLVKLLQDCAERLELAEDPPCAPAPPAPPAPAPAPPAPAPAPPAPAPRTLLAHAPGRLLCACPATYNFSVSGCSCNQRPLDNVTVVRCTRGVPRGARWPPSLALHAPGAGLTAVPRAALVELHAANNSVDALRAEDISDTLLVLDLRNNSIAHVSAAAARRLGSAGPGGAPRSVWLAGNPLACGCADRDAIELLNSAEVQAQVKDWDELRCNDGREVSALTPSELCPTTLLQTSMIAGSAMILLLLLVMSTRRWARPRLKQFLFDRQLCLSWVLRAEDAVDDRSKTHDVFISYAYADRNVAAELLRWLEERGYSTVEHSRDWQAGVPVAEHIARSVLCARRTLLLVTDSFAASAWGLQEFHAAHAHALERGSARVLPVRCGLSAPHALPEELRLYLHNNTYLSWDDPDFWDKLMRVLPPPSRAAQRPAPARGEPAGGEHVPLKPRPAAALAGCASTR